VSCGGCERFRCDVVVDAVEQKTCSLANIAETVSLYRNDAGMPDFMKTGQVSAVARHVSAVAPSRQEGRSCFCDKARYRTSFITEHSTSGFHDC
jgi:hypothetical protein